jgi:hypothetical protein
MGKEAENLGDLLEDFDADPPLAGLRAFIAHPQAEASSLLGKAVRGAKTQALPGGYLLSAFASRRGAVLAQLAIGERENELTQAVPLLRQLEMAGVLITGDALFAQRSACAHIVQYGGQYLVEVKDNQPALLLALQHCFRARAGGRRRTHR